MMNIFKTIVCSAVIGLSGSVIAAEKVDESLSAGDATSVRIENMRGQVQVIGWDKNEVVISGILDEEAEGLRFVDKGGIIDIEVEMPRHTRNHSNRDGSDLVIKMPEKMSVSFNGVSSNISVKDIYGGSDIQTVSGDIKLNTLKDFVESQSVSGNITSKELSGKITLSTVSGNIDDDKSTGRLILKAISGDIETNSTANEVFVNSVSGDAEVTLSNVDELMLSNVSGDIDASLILNKNALLKLSSVSGDFNIDFRDDVNARFSITSSAGGSLVNNITNKKATRAKYGTSSKLNFEAGDGSANVKGSTVSGRIKVSAK